MAVYVGNISDKPSSNHLAGQIRHIEGATDNQLLAQVFGVSGNAGTIASNGKISLIDLFPQNSNGTIYADPGDLERISDLTFISQHLSMITDYAALTRYMAENYPSEVQLKLREISAFSDFNSLTNEAQKAVVKYYFELISSSEVRQAIGQQNSDDQFKDGIGRIVLGKESQLSFTIHGLEVFAKLKAVHFEINPTQHLIGIKYKIVDSKINGSARQIRGNNSRKQKTQFKYFANTARHLAQKVASESTQIKLNYNHNYQDTMFPNQIQNDLIDKMAKDFDNIKRQIKNTFNQISPQEVGIDRFDDYNSATAFNHLWSELGLSNGEITTSNIDDKSVRLRFMRKISLEKFLSINKTVLVPKLQKAIAKRYSSNHIDYDAYIDRAIEFARDDLRSVDTTKLVDMARPIAHQVIDEYVSSITQIQDVHQLLDVYHMPTRQNDSKIIEGISSSLIEHVGQIQGKDNPDLKNKIDELVTKKLPKIAIERWEIFLQQQNIVLGSFLDQDLAQKYLDQAIDKHITKILAKARQLNIQNAEDYVNQYIDQNIVSEIDNYYQNNFDYSKATLAIKQNILDNLMSTIPYSKMSKDYWFNVLQKVNDYDQIKQYQHADNLDEFVVRYAPQFENDIKSQVSLTPEEVYAKFVDNMQLIKQRFIITPINQILINKDAPVYSNLPNKAKAEVSETIQNVVNALENNFNAYIFTTDIYPQDTAKNIISHYLKANASEVVANQLDQLDWDALIENVSEYEDNLKQSKQILLGMSESLFSDRQVGYQNICDLIKEKLSDHMFTNTIISLDQKQEIQKDTNNVIDEVKNKFNIMVCQEEEKKLLEKLTDGGVNFVGFVIEWIQNNQALINQIIEQHFDWNRLVELGRDEFIQRIKDDTAASQSQIIALINASVPNEEINSMTSDLLEELENVLLEDSESNITNDSQSDSKQEIINAFSDWYFDNYLIHYTNSHSIFSQLNMQPKLENLVESLEDNTDNLNEIFNQTFSSMFNDFAIDETDTIMQDKVTAQYAEIASSGEIQSDLIDDIKLVQNLISVDEYLEKVFPELGGD